MSMSYDIDLRVRRATEVSVYAKDTLCIELEFKAQLRPTESGKIEFFDYEALST